MPKAFESHPKWRSHPKKSFWSTWDFPCQVQRYINRGLVERSETDTVYLSTFERSGYLISLPFYMLV